MGVLDNIKLGGLSCSVEYEGGTSNKHTVSKWGEELTSEIKKIYSNINYKIYTSDADISKSKNESFNRINKTDKSNYHYYVICKDLKYSAYRVNIREIDNSIIPSMKNLDGWVKEDISKKLIVDSNQLEKVKNEIREDLKTLKGNI